MDPRMVSATIRHVLYKEHVGDHGKLWKLMHRDISRCKVVCTRDLAGLTSPASGEFQSFVTFFRLTTKPIEKNDILLGEAKNVVLAHLGALGGSGVMGPHVQQLAEVTSQASDIVSAKDGLQMLGSKNGIAKVAGSMVAQLNEAWRAGSYKYFVQAGEEFHFAEPTTITEGVVAITDMTGGAFYVTINLSDRVSAGQKMLGGIDGLEAAMQRAERRQGAARFDQMYKETTMSGAYPYSYDAETHMMSKL